MMLQSAAHDDWSLKETPAGQVLATAIIPVRLAATIHASPDPVPGHPPKAPAPFSAARPIASPRPAPSKHPSSPPPVAAALLLPVAGPVIFAAAAPERILAAAPTAHIIALTPIAPPPVPGPFVERIALDPRPT